MVMRVCRALLGPADADDAWSETFISALRAYPRLRPGSNVRGWLVTIAHRKAIDQLRAKQRVSPCPSSRSPTSWCSRIPSTQRDLDLWARCRHCRSSSAARSCTTTSRACPMPMSASCSTATRPRRGEQPPTASPPFASTRAASTREEPRDDEAPRPDRRADRRRARVERRVRRRHPGPAPRDPRGAGRRRRHPRRGLPDDREPDRPAAAGGHARGPGARRLRGRGPRLGARTSRRRHQPADPACAGPARRHRHAARRVLRRTDAAVRDPDRPAARARLPPDRPRAPLRHRVRHDRELRHGRRGRGQPGRGAGGGLGLRAQPDARSSCRATGWCAATARSAGTAAGSRRSARCWRWRRRELGGRGRSTQSTRSTGRCCPAS